MPINNLSDMFRIRILTRTMHVLAVVAFLIVLELSGAIFSTCAHAEQSTPKYGPPIHFTIGNQIFAIRSPYGFVPPEILIQRMSPSAMRHLKEYEVLITPDINVLLVHFLSFDDVMRIMKRENPVGMRFVVQTHRRFIHTSADVKDFQQMRNYYRAIYQSASGRPIQENNLTGIQQNQKVQSSDTIVLDSLIIDQPRAVGYMQIRKGNLNSDPERRNKKWLIISIIVFAKGKPVYFIVSNHDTTPVGIRRAKQIALGWVEHFIRDNS